MATGTETDTTSVTFVPRQNKPSNPKSRKRRSRKHLGKLSSDHRSIIILRDIEGFSYGEIADVLGVSIGTVKSRLARGRADLKKSLIRYLSVQRV